MKWPNLNGLKRKEKKTKLPEDEVEADVEVGKSALEVQRTRRNSCPNAKEMAEVVDVVVDLVIEAQKKARSQPTSRLIPAETSVDGGGGDQTSRPLSSQAVTDEPLPASVLINTHHPHDSRTPRRTSSWVVLADETGEESTTPNETNENTVSANQAVIEATKSLVSSLFPWAVDR